MFSKLPPWEPPGTTENDKVSNLRAFAELMVSPDDSDTLNNDTIPCGYTYFGQFIDHDITFDPTSSTTRQNDPNKLNNFRTPRLDLDSLYGAGPHAAPYLYENDGEMFGFLLVGKGLSGDEPDLPRNNQGRALIGDPRNDENIIVAQLQLAFLTLHNLVLAELAAGSPPTETQFHEAQRIVRWFYQYVVFNDFLKRLVHDSVHASVLERKEIPATTTAQFQQWQPRRTYYKWKKAPYIPVEFSVAAYRFGHSMVRPKYMVNAANFGFTQLPIFADPINPMADLRGGRPLPPGHSIQWDWFLQFGAPFTANGFAFPQASRKIDTLLSPAMSRIPMGDGTSAPLAFLNLLRGWKMGLPSGSNVAHEMGLEPHAINDSREDQLWFYILNETKNLGGMSGKMLGPVGGTIIAEVFAGLLAGDPLSFTSIRPRWTPADETVLVSLGLDPNTGVNGGDYELADLIKLTVDDPSSVPFVGAVDVTDPALLP